MTSPRFTHTRQATAELSPLKFELCSGGATPTHAQTVAARPNTMARSPNPFRTHGGALILCVENAFSDVIIKVSDT